MILTPNGRAYDTREELLADVARQAGPLLERSPRAQVVVPLLGNRSLGAHVFHPSPDVAARAVGLVAACRADGAVHVALERFLWDGREARAVVAVLLPEERLVVDHALGAALAACVQPSAAVRSILGVLAPSRGAFPPGGAEGG